MGLFSTILGGAKDLLGIGSSAKGLYDSFGGSDKVPGIPTPSPEGGPVSGNDYKGFMDSAFPGTTPWERLGASTGGYPSTVATAGSAQGMQSREFKQQRSITDMNNRASIIAAATPMGAQARDSNLMRYMTGFGGDDYDTHTRQEREMLPSRKAQTSAQATTSGSIAKGASLAGRGVDAITGAVSRGASKLGTLAGKFDAFDANAKARVREFVSNTGRRPRRFQ